MLFFSFLLFFFLSLFASFLSFLSHSLFLFSFFFFPFLLSLPPSPAAAKQKRQRRAAGEAGRARPRCRSSAAPSRDDFPGRAPCARDLASRYFPKSLLCPEATPSRVQPRRPVPGGGCCARAAGPGALRSSDIAGSGERRNIPHVPPRDGLTLPSRPGSRPSPPRAAPAAPWTGIAPGPGPVKPQARRGAGFAGRPSLPEGRTGPLLLLSPTASFRLPLLCPRRSRTPPNRAACLLRSGGRGDGGWELPPPGSLRPRGRGFPPIPLLLPPLCPVRFICFIPAPREGRAEGGAGSPRSPPESGPEGRGGRPRRHRGVQRPAAPGSAGAEGTAPGAPGRPSFLPVCPANPSAGGKVRVGWRLSRRKHSVISDISS